MRALPLLVTYDTKVATVRAMGRELGLDSQEVKLAVDLLEEGLPPLTRREWLPFLFGVSPKFIGAMSARPDRYYRHFRLKKKAGGYRDIVTPRRFLKTIQRWILHNILVHLPISGSTHGFIRGRNIFTNAAPHIGCQNLMVLDIIDFFPNVSKDSVVKVLLDHLPYSQPVAAQLAGLCTFSGSLPQGAPTSPALANVAFHTVDQCLDSLSDNWDCTYTRYADDLAFSGEKRFTAQDLEEVRTIIEDGGFKIHPRKSRIVGSGGRQIIAGIVVNERGLPPREMRKKWRAIFHRADQFPHEFRDRAHQLFGIASFVNQFSPKIASGYFDIARRILSLSHE